LHSKGKKIVIASVTIIALFVFCTTIEYGLTAPITNPIVVKMDNSPAVNTATETLQENTPGAAVVDYNSLAYDLDMWRAYGGVIWVGHGSQQGVETQQGSLSWKDLAAKVEDTPSKDVILTCYSAAILAYVPQGKVPLAFRGVMDAKLGALIVSYALTKNKAILGEAIQDIMDLMSGKAQPMLLRYMEPGEYYLGWGYLTNYELLTDFAIPIMMVLIFTVILGFPDDGPMGDLVNTWMDDNWPTLVQGFFQETMDLASGQSPTTDAVDLADTCANLMTDSLGTAMDAISFVFDNLSVGEAILYGVIFVAVMALTIVTLGALEAAKILVAAAQCVLALIQLLNDVANPYVVYPPPPSSGGGGGGGGGRPRPE
jgi:hypothetical protein